MKASPQVIAAFADKAKGVLVETHRLNNGEWDTARAEKHQDELSSLADFASNLELHNVHAAVLDLYAYVSVFTEGTARPNSAQRAEIERLMQDAQGSILDLTPRSDTLSGAVVYLLAPTLQAPPSLAASLKQEGLKLAVFQDGDAFAEAIRQHLPQIILAESSVVGAASELLDQLAPSVPEATRLSLVGIDNGEAGARLQALVGGADLFLARLDDPTLGAQIKELLATHTNEPFRVLVIDDDRQVGTYCEAILQRAGMRVEALTDGAQAIAAVRRFKPDLILMDLYMPQIDGMTLTQQLRQTNDAVVLPIVFLSGEQSEEARFQAIQAGGDDFLTKPIRPRHLVAAVRSRIKRVRALGKQVTKRPSDGHGYLRRGAFLDWLRDVKSRPPTGACALMIATVDQSTELQERLAWTVGHELEQAVGQRLAQSLFGDDRYCLIDEFGFAILVQRSNREAIAEMANAVRLQAVDHAFKVEGQDMRLTVSVGVALMPNAERSVDDWINSAFNAARTAKRLGGNRVEGLLGDTVAGLSPERVLRIRELLNDAVSASGLTIDFQPLIPLRAAETGRYTMAVRMRDPKEPLAGIPRSEFCAVARQLKLQAEIDRLVVTRALNGLDDQRTRNRVNEIVVPVDLLSIDRQQLTWFQGVLGRRPATEQRITMEFDAAPLLELAHAPRVLERLSADGARIGTVDRSGSLALIADLAKLPIHTLRLSAATMQSLEPSVVGPMLEPWFRARRELVVDEISDLNQISRFWNLGVDYLQGDSLATASPRLDFDFSEISLG